MRPRGKQILSLVLVCTSLVVLAVARTFVMPRASHARTYPAHDEHLNEKVTIAADPYDTAEKLKTFDFNYLEHGILPIFLVVSNDRDGAVPLVNMRLELVTRDRSKLSPLSNDDIYRRLTRIKAPTPGDSPRDRLPFPLPGHKKVKGLVPKKVAAELESARFAAMAVEPHSTQSGFVFFDVSGLSDAASGATLYVTGVKDNNGNELMYFEIPLDKYVQTRPVQ